MGSVLPGVLDLAWSLLKLKFFFQSCRREYRARSARLGVVGSFCCLGLLGMPEDILWVVGSFLSGVPRTSFASLKTARAMGHNKKPSRKVTIWGCWACFKEC